MVSTVPLPQNGTSLQPLISHNLVVCMHNGLIEEWVAYWYGHLGVGGKVMGGKSQEWAHPLSAYSSRTFSDQHKAFVQSNFVSDQICITVVGCQLVKCKMQKVLLISNHGVCRSTV